MPKCHRASAARHRQEICIAPLGPLDESRAENRGGNSVENTCSKVCGDGCAAEIDAACFHFVEIKIEQFVFVFQTKVTDPAAKEVADIGHSLANRHRLPIQDSDRLCTSVDIEQHVVEAEISMHQALRLAVPLMILRRQCGQFLAQRHVFRLEPRPVSVSKNGLRLRVHCRDLLSHVERGLQPVGGKQLGFFPTGRVDCGGLPDR